MRAQELNGLYIGKQIEYALPYGRGESTEEITMILHKKNGRVQVRHGKNNRQRDLHPDTIVREVVNGS